MTRALIATDGSPLAKDAASRAAALLGPGTSFTVACVAEVPIPVVPAPGFAGGAGITAGTFDVDLEDEVRANARGVAEETARELGAGAEAIVLNGSPGPALCDHAAEGGFDVLVVGSHGSGFVKRMLLGSVSHHVLHNAPCPVLVVREANEED